MLAEFSHIAGRILLLLHKIVEILRTEPRVFTEYLNIEYAKNYRDKHFKNIVLKVVCCSGYALAPDHLGDIQERHRVEAQERRAKNENQD